MSVLNIVEGSRIEFAFGGLYYGGTVRGTYRRQKDWYRVLFDDGVSLTVHLDPKSNGTIWRPEKPKPEGEGLAVVVGVEFKSTPNRRKRKRSKVDSSATHEVTEDGLATTNSSLCQHKSTATTADYDNDDDDDDDDNADDSDDDNEAGAGAGAGAAAAAASAASAASAAAVTAIATATATATAAAANTAATAAPPPFIAATGQEILLGRRKCAASAIKAAKRSVCIEPIKAGSGSGREETVYVSYLVQLSAAPTEHR
jgi:hypothetical protein